MFLRNLLIIEARVTFARFSTFYLNCSGVRMFPLIPEQTSCFRSFCIPSRESSRVAVACDSFHLSIDLRKIWPTMTRTRFYPWYANSGFISSVSIFACSMYDSSKFASILLNSRIFSSRKLSRFLLLILASFSYLSAF